jgi:Fic family protein
VPDLLQDLCAFCAGDALPAVAQAAIAHVQFETIHPFVDGNGRTGRALIHMVLRRRGLAAGIVPPVSLILATWSRQYLAALDAAHYVGPATSEEARAATDSWVALFAAACSRACADAADFERRLELLREDWLRAAAPVRTDSALERIVRLLPAAPVLTVRSAAALADRSLQATNEAINRLVDVHVLRQITVGRRNRAFEAPEAIEAFAYLERRLTSPAADTIVSPPSRRVPRKP